MKTSDLNILRIYTIFHHTYKLLYIKGHVQITSNKMHHIYEKKSNRVNKMEYIGFKYT